MISQFYWRLRHATKQLWFTVAAYSMVGVATALSALVLDPLLPVNVSSKVGADAVDRILGILASSMLAVTTFSIATMVQAFASAGNGATPRATQLLVEDRTAQRALATFIGSFVFSLVSIIALSTGAYGPSGRLVLFAVTIGVIALIVVMLLRWIDRLSRLGRVGETIDQVEVAVTRAIRADRNQPNLGGRCAMALPADVIGVFATKIGYIQRIDMSALAAVAKIRNCDIHVRQRPGSFTTPNRALASLLANVTEEDQDKVRAAFEIADARSFDQDPRFGVIVLSEIASRALSPAVNDPGTAIDVIGTLVRVINEWAVPKDALEKVEFPRIFVPPLKACQLLEDSFAPIARDGAQIVEVCIRTQKALQAIAAMPLPELRKAAISQARYAHERAEQNLSNDHDKQRLRHAAKWSQDGDHAACR